MGLYIFAVELNILKLEETSLCYSASYFDLVGVELCFGGAKPTKAPPRGEGPVWQNFSLLFNVIDSEKYLGYTICQTCKRTCVKLSFYKHVRAQSGTTYSDSVNSAS